MNRVPDEPETLEPDDEDPVVKAVLEAVEGLSRSDAKLKEIIQAHPRPWEPPD